MTDCPTCGQKVDELDRPLHDAARRLVSFNGKTAHLGYAGNLIFEILLRRHPLTTHWETIAGSIWAGQDIDSRNNFCVQISYMRNGREPEQEGLKNLGVRIASDKFGAGLGFYWLTW